MKNADDAAPIEPQSSRNILSTDIGSREPAYRQSGYNSHLVETSGSGWETNINLLDYWRILRKRQWVVLGVLATCFTIGLFGSLLMKPKYTASVSIQLDRHATRIVESGNITPSELLDRDFFQTQYELLKSRALAQRVVARLSLAADDKFLGRSSASSITLIKNLFTRGGSQPEGNAMALAARERSAIGIVMANTVVEPIRNSRLVIVKYVGSTPEQAQTIANAIAEGFVSSNLDRRIEANAYAKGYLEDQLQELKLKLEESDRVLLDFAQKEQIVSIGEKSSLTEANLAASNTSLGVVVGERIKAEQLWRQMESAVGLALPQILNNQVIQSLREKRIDLATDYKEKLNTFKPSYPEMLRIKARIDDIDQQVSAEVNNIKESLRAAYLAARNQEELIAAQLDFLKSESLGLQRRSIQFNILKREADTNRSIYDGLLQRYKEVGIAGGVGANNISIVDRAEKPGTPSSPQVLLNVGLASLIGLASGIGLALLREYVDDTLKSAEDIERATGLPVLGVVPNITGDTDVSQQLADPRSAASEAYRSLTTALQFSTQTGVPKTLLVTSAKPSEGKSTTSLALARNFAALGQKVALVDCDLRNPSLHRSLGLDNSFGVTNYLAGGSKLSEIFVETDRSNLYFAPTGPLPPSPAELLAGSRLRMLLSICSEQFDIVILDGPPVMGLADAPLLGSAAAGTLLVASAGETRAVAVKAATKRLRFTRSALIGTVLTKFDSRNVGYGYGYGDYEYYSYGNSPSRELGDVKSKVAALPQRDAA